MLTKTLGSLVGAPLMAFLWVQAIKLGGIGVGLPYYVSAVSKRTMPIKEILIYFTVYLSRCSICHRKLAKVEDYFLTIEEYKQKSIPSSQLV